MDNNNNFIHALELYSAELCEMNKAVKEYIGDESADNRIICSQLDQVYDAFSSILLLLKKEKVSSSNVLLRVLFESHIQLIYIIEDKESLEEKLLVYRYFMYYNMKKDIETKIKISKNNRHVYEELVEYRNSISDSLECIESLIKDEALKLNLHDKDLLKNWYSLSFGKELSIRQLAKQVCFHNNDKKKWSLFYDDLYPQLSMYVHGYKGYESVGHKSSQEELFASVVNLIVTACSFIFNDLYGWLSKTGYIDNRVNQRINLGNLALANELINSMHK